MKGRRIVLGKGRKNLTQSAQSTTQRREGTPHLVSARRLRATISTESDLWIL